MVETDKFQDVSSKQEIEPNKEEYNRQTLLDLVLNYIQLQISGKLLK